MRFDVKINMGPERSTALYGYSIESGRLQAITGGYIASGQSIERPACTYILLRRQHTVVNEYD